MTFEARDNAAKVVPATTENTVQEENQRTSLKVTLFFFFEKLGNLKGTDQILHLKRIDT